ncbi:MAG: hypothetical protein ACTSYC_06265, partial [Promethearchaeota archaeon]
MNQNKSRSFKREKIISLLENLWDHYKNENPKGIFFNLREAKSPLDILGVLDVLKYKIQEWNNTNIFSYKGVLFEHQPILVIGSDTIDEAGKITILVYITRIIENKTDVS